MLSPPDLIVIGAAALLFFGPDQLPKVARRAGQVVREVQNTSQSFIREIERAADEPHSAPTTRHDWSADFVDRSGFDPAVPGGPERAPGAGRSEMVEPTYAPSGPVYAPVSEAPAEAARSAEATRPPSGETVIRTASYVESPFLDAPRREAPPPG